MAARLLDRLVESLERSLQGAADTPMNVASDSKPGVPMLEATPTGLAAYAAALLDAMPDPHGMTKP